MTKEERKDLALYIFDDLNLQEFNLTVKQVEISISDALNEFHSERCENKVNKEIYSLENLIDQDPSA
jgi:hypothetical protein